MFSQTKRIESYYGRNNRKIEIEKKFFFEIKSHTILNRESTEAPLRHSLLFTFN